jgi:hypothetical protein
VSATTTGYYYGVCDVFFLFFFSFFLDSPLSYSGRSVARQQLLATSLRLDNRALLGAGNSCAPDLLLAKSGFGGLHNRNFHCHLIGALTRKN